MQILSLELENVKSYAKAKIDFRRGVNAIVGWNGAGKSTILEAIGFALFDHIGYNQRDFVREGQKTGTVAVTFISSDDLRHYQVVRKFGSSNQHYIFDSELDVKLVEGKADVLTFLRQHMGVEPSADLARLFSDAVGVPQGAFTAAFLGTPAQRKATFDPLLQVDEYRKAFDALREPLNTLKERGQALAVHAAGLAARLEQLPELETAIAKRTTELGDAERTLAELAKKLHEIEQAHAKLEAEQQQLQTLQQRQSALAERHGAGERRVAEAKRLLADAQTAAETVTAHQAGHDMFVAAQAEQRVLDERVRERQSLRDQLNEADKRLALTRNDLARLDQDMAVVVAAVATVKQLAPALTEQQRLEEGLNAARQQAARRQELAGQIEQQTAHVEALQTRVEKLSAQLAEATRIDAQRIELEATLAVHEQRLDTLREEQAQMKAAAASVNDQSAALESAATALCPVCEQPLSDEHRTSMLTRNEQKLEEMRGAYRETQEQITAESDALTAARQQLKALEQTLRTLPRPGEQEELQREIAARGETLAAQQRLLAASADISQEIEQYEKELSALGNPREQNAIAAAEAARLEEIDRRREELNSAATVEQAAVDDLKQRIDAFGDLDDAISITAQALEAHRAAYQAVLGNQQLAAGAERQAHELAAMQAEQEALLDEAATLAVKLAEAEADFDSQRYAAVALEAQQARSEQAATQTRQSMLAEDQARDEMARERLRAVELEMETIRTEQAACARQEEVLDALRRVLREAGPYITATLIRQISEDAARIFSELMQDYTRHLTWTEDFNIILDVDGNARQFSQLSGGEQMSAALAVRLALLREMSSIDIAFFDEPTTNLDETRRDNLAQQILKVKGLRQLFVISHDDTFEQATQNLIRVQKDGSVSRVVEDS